MGSYLNYNNFGLTVHDNNKLDEPDFTIHNDDEAYFINLTRKMPHTTDQYRCTYIQTRIIRFFY